MARKMSEYSPGFAIVPSGARRPSGRHGPPRRAAAIPSTPISRVYARLQLRVSALRHIRGVMAFTPRARYDARFAGAALDPGLVTGGWNGAVGRVTLRRSLCYSAARGHEIGSRSPGWLQHGTLAPPALHLLPQPSR